MLAGIKVRGCKVKPLASSLENKKSRSIEKVEPCHLSSRDYASPVMGRRRGPRGEGEDAAGDCNAKKPSATSAP
jgi:hypothetical protein